MNKRKMKVSEISSIDTIATEIKTALFNSDVEITDSVKLALSKLDDYVEKDKVLNKKAPWVFVLLVALIILPIIAISLILDRNDALKSKIDTLETGLSVYQSRDSLYDILLGIDSTKTVRYRLRDNVPISYPQLVKENDSLQTEQNKLLLEKDSYRIKYELITKNLPIQVTEEGKYYVLHSEQVDSALMLLKMYRDKIEFDTERQVWSVTR